MRVKILNHNNIGEGGYPTLAEMGWCRLDKLVKDLTSLMNVFREEIFRYMFWSMSLGNHEPRTLGPAAVTIFFFYVPQYDGTSFLQNIVIGTG